jgi:hypothetical protein
MIGSILAVSLQTMQRPNLSSGIAMRSATAPPYFSSKQTGDTSMIKPTIGRVVWFWQRVEPESQSQPYAALVTYVHSDTLVNLAYFDSSGLSHSATSIELWQGEGDRPAGRHCEWMPYQKGQAAKAEALEKSTQ